MSAAATSIVLRAYAELVDFLDAPEVELPIGGPRSVKDLVEAAGIPHPEVGLLLVDGRRVGFDHLLTGGERVAAYPPFHGLDPVGGLWPSPPEPRRFVLDVHLGTLTRRLRLLGFDAWYRTDADDALLADVAVGQERILLTRDRGLLMRRTITHGYCPRSQDPDEQAVEVARRYSLAPRRAPLTRCVRCNGLLHRAHAAQVWDELEPGTRAAFDRFSRCGGCGQVYWPGSHLDAVEGFLTRIEAMTSPRGAPPPGTGPVHH